MAQKVQSVDKRDEPPMRRITIPEPVENDFEDVHWALSAASTLWERGEGREALKWLRRAAGAAADRDADARAVELFKAAADVASEIERGAAPRAAPGGGPAPKRRGEPRALLGLQFDESEEDTFVRPETLVRRALLAIDPDYARRTDYSSADDSSEVGAYDSDGEAESGEDTTRRSSRGSDGAAGPSPDPSALATGLPGALPALRVAVIAVPEEGDVRLLFLPPGADPPPGVAVALLVPPSQRDAELIARIYRECDAKL